MIEIMNVYNISDEQSTQKKKFRIPAKRVLYYICFSIIIFCAGLISGVYVLEYYLGEDENGKVLSSQEHPDDLAHMRDDEPIRSPLNGILLSEEEYEEISKNIPHAVMISNNVSARDEQYGLSYADIVYEAETEAGITRFMAIFWSNQEGFIMKPVRSVRKYYLDWAVEYDNMPVTFSGFAQTADSRTDAWGFYKEQDIRVTYFDWPLLWDEECLKTHPTMHCKRTTLELLYGLFEKHEWTFKSWDGFRNDDEWVFDDQNITSHDYEDVDEFQYNFTAQNDWSSRWVYDSVKNIFQKYEPDEVHVDMNNQNQIEADTIIIMKMQRSYTGDDKGRVAYETVGSGDAYVLRDGKKIEGMWEKSCPLCRTHFYSLTMNDQKDDEIPLNPGLIWIAAVPTDQEVQWGTSTD